MSSIGSISNPYLPVVPSQTPASTPTSTEQTTGTTPANTGVPTPGTGVIAPSTAIPAASSTQSPQQSFILAMVAESLHQFMPALSGDDQDVLLAEIQMKMKETVNGTDNNEIKNKSDARKNQEAEVQKKLDDAAKKLEDMIKLQNSGNIFDKIKAFFEMIFAILQLVTEAISVVMTFGATAPAMMSLMPMSLMMLDDGLKTVTGLGIAGNLDKLVHPKDPESWHKADQIFEYTMMAAAAVEMIAMMAAGQEEVVGEMVEMAVIVALQRALDVVQVATTVVEAAGDITSAVINEQATAAKAESKRDEARAKELQTMMKHLDEMIELAIKRLQTDGDRWSKMLDSITSSMQDRANTVGKAKLTA